MPSAQGQLLKDKLRDHRKKKKHHLERGGNIDPQHTEESCLVNILKDESINQRGQKINEGHAAQLGEFKQPTVVRVNSDEQLQREVNTDKFDTVQLCKLANPIEVEVVKDMEHADQLWELQLPTMVRVTSEVQGRELKSDKLDTAQYCKLANPIKVEAVKNGEHNVSMEEHREEIMGGNSKHKRKRKKKRINMKQDDICQLSGKPNSYVKINQPKKPDKATEFQKKVTHTNWDATNDEKPDGFVKELSEMKVNIQIKTDEDLEKSIEVDTDPEKTVQSEIYVDKKRETAPSHTGSPRGLAGEVDACLVSAPSPVSPQGESGAEAAATKPEDEVEQESALLFLCEEITEKNPPDKLSTPINSNILEGCSTDKLPKLIVPKVLEKDPPDKLPIPIVYQALEMTSKAGEQVFAKKAQQFQPVQQALEAEDLAQSSMSSLSSKPWKQKTWQPKSNKSHLLRGSW